MIIIQDSLHDLQRIIEITDSKSQQRGRLHSQETVGNLNEERQSMCSAPDGHTSEEGELVNPLVSVGSKQLLDDNVEVNQLGIRL